jgi:hypothetical protein
MKNSTSTKAWTRMSADDLATATALFDDPDYVPPVVPIPSGLDKRHRRALASLREKAANHRARRTRIQVTLENALLKKADELAHRQGLSRSQMVAAGLRLLIVV